jgi:crotonobetainyl-CoA:carnitine CoA-transferase CaiB-like acyl-CoA transferase
MCRKGNQSGMSAGSDIRVDSVWWGGIRPQVTALRHVTGEPDGPPTSVGLPIYDLGTGMWAVQGILAALYERQPTGKGRLVECSLLETAIGFSSWTSAQWLADHEEPTRQGSCHRQNAPYQRMQTRDGYLMA